MTEISTIQEKEKFLKSNDLCVLYFYNEQCSVCNALLPKVEDLLKKKYNKINLCTINTKEAFELSASCNVFSAPTILIYAFEKENNRFVRNLSLMDLDNAIMRLNNLIYL